MTRRYGWLYFKNAIDNTKVTYPVRVPINIVVRDDLGLRVDLVNKERFPIAIMKTSCNLILRCRLEPLIILDKSINSVATMGNNINYLHITDGLELDKHGWISQRT